MTGPDITPADLYAAIGALRRNETTLAAAARGLGVARQVLHWEVWAVTRTDVLARDLSLCVRCGVSPAADVHHRLPRGLGGTSDPLCAYGMANLIALCRACHSWCEITGRSTDPGNAYASGWLLRRGDDPEDTPILYRGQWRWLTHDGRVNPLRDSTIPEETCR